MDECKFLLTGYPGSGKSTVLLRCTSLLKEEGFKIGGIITPEVKRHGRRMGFRVIDLSTGREEILADLNFSSRYRIGRYGINIKGFEDVALSALDNAGENCDVLCIDEIGPMELFSRKFELKAGELIKGLKPMIVVLHRKYVERYKAYGKLFHVSAENRDYLPGVISSTLKSSLAK